MTRRCIFALTLFATGCPDVPAPPAFGSSDETVEPTGTATTTTTVGADSSTSGPPPEPVVVLAGTFDLEVRDAIDVEVAQLGTAPGAEVVVTIDADADFGVMPTTPIVGVGRIDAYPEAAATVYTAVFAVPAIRGGRCGDEPVTLALSLHAVTGSPQVAASEVVAGGLTAYCGHSRGGETPIGPPVIEPLRVFGRRSI